jgi:hypothetical protein
VFETHHVKIVITGEVVVWGDPEVSVGVEVHC